MTSVRSPGQIHKHISSSQRLGTLDDVRSPYSSRSTATFNILRRLFTIVSYGYSETIYSLDTTVYSVYHDYSRNWLLSILRCCIQHQKQYRKALIGVRGGGGCYSVKQTTIVFNVRNLSTSYMIVWKATKLLGSGDILNSV